MLLLLIVPGDFLNLVRSPKVEKYMAHRTRDKRGAVRTLPISCYFFPLVCFMAVSKTDPSAFVASESTKRVWDRAAGLVGVFQAPMDRTASRRPVSLICHLASISFLAHVQAASYHRTVRRACGNVCIDEEGRKLSCRRAC
jgi:hypothetical protein